MSTLNRRMFQDGGTVDATGVRTLKRKPIIQGYRDPKTVGYETLEYENGKYYQRARDEQGNLMKDVPVNLALSPTRDPVDAYQKQQMNTAVSQSLFMTPLGGTAAGTTLGLGFLGTKFGPRLAQLLGKYVSPVTASLKPGRAVSGMKGFQPQNPYNPFSYQNPQVNPTGALLTGGTTAVTQVPKLYAQETELDTSDPNFLTAQLAIINNPDASDIEKQAARDLINAAINPTDTIQEDLDDLGTPTPSPTPTPAPEEVVEEEPEEQVQEEPQGQEKAQRTANSLSNFFSSDAFNSALRNIGSSLVREGRFGAGLAAGAAGFAEEQEAKRLLEEDRMAKYNQFLLEQSLKGDGMDFSDLAKVGDVGEGVNEAIRNFEGSNASIGIMNDLIALFEEAQEKGVPVTGLQGRLERFKDEASAFLGIEKEASTATKIQNMINIVKNRQIRELLGESGRTISNLDREIVDKVFGEISFTDNPAESLKKLKEARGTLQSSARQYQRDVKTGREQLKSRQAGDIGKSYMSEYGDLINDILNIDVDKIIEKGYNPTVGARVVKIKLRGE